MTSVRRNFLSALVALATLPQAGAQAQNDFSMFEYSMPIHTRIPRGNWPARVTIENADLDVKSFAERLRGKWRLGFLCAGAAPHSARLGATGTLSGVTNPFATFTFGADSFARRIGSGIEDFFAPNAPSEDPAQPSTSRPWTEEIF